jgi:hypothetical protein
VKLNERVERELISHKSELVIRLWSLILKRELESMS